MSPLCIVFSRLVWRKFVAAAWDYISQLSTTKQNPIRCYYVTTGDITLSSLGRLGRTESAGRGVDRGARLVNGRPVQLHSLLSAAAAASGGIKLFENNHTRGGALLDKGVLKERGEGDEDRGLGAAVRTGRRRDGSACFQMPTPARALEQPTGSMSPSLVTV